MDIDGVALVAGAGKAQFRETPCHGLRNVPFAEIACADFIHRVEEQDILIYYLTGSGIGREVALTLASRGAHALICADINLEAAKQTAEMSHTRLAEHLKDYRVHALHVDVRHEDGVQQMVNKAKSLFGRIDYFVNTAGVSSIIGADSYTQKSNRLKLEIHSLLRCFALSFGLHIADIVSWCSLAHLTKKTFPQCPSRTTGSWMKFTI